MRCDSAIELRGVSKKFRLFSSQRDRLLEALWPKKMRHTEFWALRDIDLVIPRGQTIGILGRNGSGKSTLLQILAGIFPPSSGDVVVNGRVSALLELGAGFNPEFSGRENVLMNGLLRGLSPDEMRVKMPEIEAFADVGAFFDHPVKTYSSGMFVRVAFAAAINVDPDILLVDEALAVGDSLFQKKCYDKILKFRNEGKTCVLVSHDMQSILHICSDVVVLDQGGVVFVGNAEQGCKHYHNVVLEMNNNVDMIGCCSCGGDEAIVGYNLFSSNSNGGKSISYGDFSAKLISCVVYDSSGKNVASVVSGEEYKLIFRVKALCRMQKYRCGMHFAHKKGFVMYGINTTEYGCVVSQFEENDEFFVAFGMRLLFAPGDYFVTFGITSESGDTVYCRYVDAIVLPVTPAKNRFKPESLVDCQAIVSIEKVK